MKNKLQTLLKHKLQWLLLLAALLGVSQGVWANGSAGGPAAVRLYKNSSNTWYNVYSTSWGYTPTCTNYTTIKSATSFSGDLGTVTTLYISGYAKIGWADGSDWVAAQLGYKIDSGSYSYIKIGNYDSAGSGSADVACISNNDRVCGYVGWGSSTYNILSDLSVGSHTLYLKPYGKMQWNNNGSSGTYDGVEHSEVSATFTVPGWSTTSGTKAFGSVNVGSNSSATVSLGTHYGATSTVTSSITGTNASDFSVTSVSATSVTVGFTPSAAGSRTATVTITDAYSKTYTLTVSGTGTSTCTPLTTSNYTLTGSLNQPYSGTSRSVTITPKSEIPSGTLYYTGTYYRPGEGASTYAKNTTAPTHVGEYDITYEVAASGSYCAATLNFGKLRVNTYDLKSSLDSWGTGVRMTSTDGTSYTATLSSPGNIDLKLFDTRYITDTETPEAWAGNNEKPTITIEDNTAAFVFGQSGNVSLNADVLGDYTFTYNSSTGNLTVTYPCLPPTSGTATAGGESSTTVVYNGSTTIAVTGYEEGSTIAWQVSTDGGSSWSSASQTTASFTASSITTATKYRAIITKNDCSVVTNEVTVNITYRIRVKKTGILSSSAYIHIWESETCNTTWESCPAMTASDDGQWWYYDCSSNPANILFKDATGNVTNGNHQTNDINRGSSSTDFCYEVTSNKTDGSSKQDVGTTSCCTAPTAADFAISNNTYTFDGNAHRATVASNTEGYTPASITWGHGANSSSTTSNKTTAGTYGTYVLSASASGDYCAVTSAISTSVGNLIIEKADQAALSISTTPTTTCMGNTFTLETSGGTDSGAVTYEIVSGGSGSGSIVGTTLSASVAGTINVKATKAATTNYNAATAEQTFTFNANPSAPVISSYDESVCSESAPKFTFSSTSGLTYQMYVGSSTSGSSVAGDGSSKTLTAGAITSATTFNLRATDANGCYASSADAAVSITPDMALTSITLSPSTICAGGESTVTANGLVLGGGSVAYTSSAPAKATVAKVSDSEATVTGVAVGSSTITATLSGGCGSTVPQTATITVSAGPETYTLSAAGGTTICSAGGKLRLSGSESGFSYQLYKNGSAYGSPVTGTGSAIEFDVFESGDYVCRAYLTSSPSCYTVMTGEVTLHISLTPTLIPATPTVTSYTPVTITSINTDILTWEISGEGNTAYLYDKTSNTVKVKASAAGSPYTITATTSGGCSQTATLTVNADVEVCD